MSWKSEFAIYLLYVISNPLIIGVIAYNSAYNSLILCNIRFCSIIGGWKSHATLTLFGKQDLPPLATI